MADLMKFLSNINRLLKIVGDPAEPTIPGPVIDDQMRIWNGYSVFDHGALNPVNYNDINAIWVDSVVGLNTNPGTQLLPVKTIQQAVLISTPIKNTIVIDGVFRERVVIGSNYVPPGYGNINNQLVNLISKSSVIVYLSAPNEYPVSEEFQLNWNATFADQLFEVSFSPGTRGDYIQDNQGRLRYLLPNSNFTEYTTPRGAYQWYIDDGHTLVKWNNNFPQYRSIKEIQHIGFVNKCLGLVIPTFRFGMGGMFITKFDPGIGETLTNARDPGSIDLSDQFGQLPFAFPVSYQIAGCTPSTDHWKGNIYSGWVTALCRCFKHEGRFLAATVSVNQGYVTGTNTDEYITIWKYSPGPGWTMVDEWLGAHVVHIITSSRKEIHIDYEGIGLIACHEHVYFVNGIINRPAMAYNTSGEIRVSTGSIFTLIDIDGKTKCSDFCYFADHYYCTTSGQLYRSVNGITDWMLVYKNDSYWLSRMTVINNVMFISVLSGNPKLFAYTLDGYTIKFQNVAAVANRESILGGLAFQSNGRVCLTHAIKEPGIYAGSPPPGTGTMTPYPMISFQEAVINYEKTDQNNYWHIDNIDVKGTNESDQVVCGSQVTEGQGYNL